MTLAYHTICCYLMVTNLESGIGLLHGGQGAVNLGLDGGRLGHPFLVVGLGFLHVVQLRTIAMLGLYTHDIPFWDCLMRPGVTKRCRLF
jgi:hypothetical protein